MADLCFKARQKAGGGHTVTSSSSSALLCLFWHILHLAQLYLTWRVVCLLTTGRQCHSWQQQQQEPRHQPSTWQLLHWQPAAAQPLLRHRHHILLPGQLQPGKHPTGLEAAAGPAAAARGRCQQRHSNSSCCSCRQATQQQQQQQRQVRCYGALRGCSG
jgi:hypothetical protein